MLLTKIYQRLKTHTLFVREISQAFHIKYNDFLERRGAQAVVLGETGRWKALRKQSATAPIEIYDLDNDLGETKDIAADHPELVARAEELFKEQHVPNPLWNAPFKPRKR